MPTGVHLRCVDKDEAQKLMEVVHEGVCRPHMNGTVLTKKIARHGYFLADHGDRLCQIYEEMS